MSVLTKHWGLEIDKNKPGDYETDQEGRSPASQPMRAPAATPRCDGYGDAAIPTLQQVAETVDVSPSFGDSESTLRQLRARRAPRAVGAVRSAPRAAARGVSRGRGTPFGGKDARAPPSPAIARSLKMQKTAAAAPPRRAHRCAGDLNLQLTMCSLAGDAKKGEAYVVSIQADDAPKYTLCILRRAPRGSSRLAGAGRAAAAAKPPRVGASRRRRGGGAAA